MKPWVYIAGPYSTGDKEKNTIDMMQVFDQLLQTGEVVPYCPLWTHFQDLAYPQPYEVWLKYDLDLLMRFDALLRIPGESSGADGEVARMKELKRPVFFETEKMLEWARKQ